MLLFVVKGTMTKNAVSEAETQGRTTRKGDIGPTRGRTGILPTTGTGVCRGFCPAPADRSGPAEALPGGVRPRAENPVQAPDLTSYRAVS